MLLLNALAKKSTDLTLRFHFYMCEIQVLHCNVFQCCFVKDNFCYCDML